MSRFCICKKDTRGTSAIALFPVCLNVKSILDYKEHYLDTRWVRLVLNANMIKIIFPSEQSAFRKYNSD